MSWLNAIQQKYEVSMQAKKQREEQEAQQRKEEANVWVKDVLRPFINENVEKGQIRIRTVEDPENRFRKARDDEYISAIEDEGLKILCLGRNYIDISWKPEHTKDNTLGRIMEL